MISEGRIRDVVEKFFDQRSDLFLVEVNISRDNDIYVFVDGDKGVTIEDCALISNFLRNSLPADENYSLQVSSWGVESPLKLKRQFVKNIGQTVRVMLQDGTVHYGQLVSVKDDFFTIEIVRGLKVKVSEKKDIRYNDCKKVQVKLSFGKKQ